MKRINLLIALCSLLFSAVTHAQQNAGSISGTVIGAEKPVEAATITLLRAKDSSVAKLAVTTRGGKFEIDQVRSGAYLLSVQAVGFRKYFTEVFEVTNGTKELPAIELTPAASKLQDVTVSSRKPLVEQRIDKTIVNVDAAVTNAGSNAMEVLEKSPGISVDKDGNISLKGKDGVLVLIDGRQTFLGAADLANMLRNMNASQLDQIEIMTNPPARYDAAGNAGIINIKTKKTKQFGYSGSLSANYSQGVYAKANEALVFNYRKGKVNLFTNLSHNYRKGFQNLDIQRNFLNGTTKQVESYFEQQARMINEGNSFNGKLGLDYFASKKTTYGIVLSGFHNTGDFTNRNVNMLFSPPGNHLERTNALVAQTEEWKNFAANVNFRHVLDSTGKEITADVDYITYDAAQRLSLKNMFFTPSGGISRKADTLLGNLPQLIDIYSAKVDYLHPLKKGAKLEAGLKTSFVKTDNDARYDSISNGQLVKDENRSNRFLYEEIINAAYVNLSAPLSKKWSGQFGLRAENTIAKGNQIATGETFDRNYTQLFPTAFIQYKANEKNSYVLNYGRRIRRPNYQSLNPFIEFLDRYTYEQGNPNLQPQFSHNIELSHTYCGFLTTTLNYTRTNNIIGQVIEQIAADTLTYIKQMNIARQRQYGISVSAGMPVTKWWTSTLYVNVFNNRFSGLIDGENVTAEATTLMLNGSQQFKLSKKSNMEISGWYRTAGLEGVIRIQGMGMVSLGYSHQIMKGKGTLRMNIRDIFWTQRVQGVLNYASVDGRFQQFNDSRVFNIGLTYRFSKGKMSNNQRKRSGGASEEASRVGGGN